MRATSEIHPSETCVGQLSSLLEWNLCEKRDSGLVLLPQHIAQTRGQAHTGCRRDWVDHQLTSPHLFLCPIFWPLFQFAICLLSTFLFAKYLHTQLFDCDCGLGQRHIRWGLTNLRKCSENPGGRGGSWFHLPPLLPTAWRGRMAALGL